MTPMLLNKLVTEKIFPLRVSTTSPNFISDFSLAETAINKVISEFAIPPRLQISVWHNQLKVSLISPLGEPVYCVMIAKEESLCEAMCLCALGAKEKLNQV